MLGVAILSLVFVVVFTIAAILVFRSGNSGTGTLFLVVVMLLGFLTITMARNSYRGHHLTAINLNSNEIYETVGAVEDDSTFYVTIRNRDGDARTFRLDTVPPPIFKVIRVSPDSVLYRPYPTEN